MCYSAFSTLSPIAGASAEIGNHPTPKINFPILKSKDSHSIHSSQCDISRSTFLHIVSQIKVSKSFQLRSTLPGPLDMKVQ